MFAGLKKVMAAAVAAGLIALGTIPTQAAETGLQPDGSRDEPKAVQQIEFWKEIIAQAEHKKETSVRAENFAEKSTLGPRGQPEVISNLTRDEFIRKVERSQRYIFAGDIYQVNLSQRLSADCADSGWQFFKRLASISPAPFSAFLDYGEFQVASSSPETFLRMSGSQIQTRPIKGTRPRSADSNRDAQLTYELQTSAKEMAELVMITDLLRNDLGKVCEYGSVQVPELVRLERYPQVQHLVSTVEGRLRNDVTHFAAFASSLPGGEHHRRSKNSSDGNH